MQLTFSIPHNATFLPKKGDAVKIGDPILQFQSSDFITYDIARVLSIKPDMVFSHLTIVVGQEVSPGTILAERKGFVGKKQAQSDVTGIIDRIQLETGEIVVRHGTQSTDKVQKAWFNGTVHNIAEDGKNFTIAFKDADEVKLSTVNMDGGGELFVMEEKDFFSIGTDEIGHKVILLEQPHVHIISKLDALDAGGCIAPTDIPPSDVPSAKTSTEKVFKELIHTKKVLCFLSARYESSDLLIFHAIILIRYEIEKHDQ
ncbi:MAG: hypothetical protein UZ22_OP11002001094 [Microgenomates bacterium OLB23]|nr:MAG: hypothetical protein UZ22_OP11002001094 [Microgenomates bacterium OLB23]